MMRCGYMILTFLLALAVVSPALLAVRGIFMGSYITGESGALGTIEAIGLIELIVAAGVGGILFIAKGMPAIIAKAKAELDALKAGMRGEK